MLGGNNKYEGNLHRRFVLRVLTPPFIALFVLSLIGLWQLDVLLRKQATDNLRRSAQTAATSLQREFELRETVLKRTGAELFVIKSKYQADRTKLDENRAACQQYLRTSNKFQNAPDNACQPFAAGLSASPKLSTLEDEYVRVGQQLIDEQNQRINDRLSAFKQFFPETLALIITDSEKQVVSSALSGAFKGSIDAFKADSDAAIQTPVVGRQLAVENFRLSVFAFPISGGSVLAAYDNFNEAYLRPTWDRLPVDRSQEVAVFLDKDNNVVYPNIVSPESFKNNGTKLRTAKAIELSLDSIAHTAIAAPVGASEWQAVIASPSAAVLAPLRDAQIVALLVIGLFMLGFTWVGSFFIQRTLQTLVTLVSGALVFGSGRLDYKIVLDHADSEFVRLGETMNVMAERIASAEKAMDEKNKEFISLATHEIRAPLTAIIGHISLLKDMYSTKLDQKANGILDQAYYGTARLRDLVNDMLNVARLESGRSEFSLAPLDIKPIIEEITDNMSIVAQIAKVDLKYVHTHATHVTADEGRFRIIVNNFVSNAIKYNRPGGKVVISHQQKNNELITMVSDTGLGIPDDQKAHMFEKFFRVSHEDRRHVTGTGLGMYIVKQYVEQMHGKVWFESSHGKGTTFYFSLPIANIRLRTRISTRVKKIAHRKK